MAYVGVVKALYDYDAQNPEDELSFKEDQILYVVEKGDDEWWKAKLKEEAGGDGPLGLIPCTYVEEMTPTHQVRALYAYESTSPEELSMEEDAVLNVYAEEDEWILVHVEGGSDKLGFVPKNYCEAGDEAEAAEEPEDTAALAQQEEEDRQRSIAAKQRELALNDKVETWSISELDGKKKKKGSFSVGNGTIFFASESDKSPIKQYRISDLTHVEQTSSKVIALTIASLGQPLQFHTGSAKTSKSILEKLASSKQAAGEALQVATDAAAESSEEEEVAPAPVNTRRVSEPKTVRFTEPEPDSPVAAPRAPAAAGGSGSCLVLYDFSAKGDDELTVEENERLTIVDRSDDEWWLVRNSQGQEGVVPAQYVELDEGGGAANGSAQSESSAVQAQAQAAAAAAAAERSAKEEAQRRERERREREEAAREKAEQEALDRELAEQIEAEERQKRREAEERARAEAQKRRQAAREMAPAPPEVSKRRGADPQAAARNLSSGRDRAAPRPAPETARPRPNPSRVRTWSDRTGQFTVEAEFLGLSGNKLRLHKTNGVIIEVPFEKMSPEDVQMIKRYQARKKERSATVDDEDTPLGWQHPPRRPSEQMSAESASRSSQKAPTKRRPTFDWFAFFLEAGCDMDDCTRYSTNFDRDRIDETILTDLDASTMRSLGLREGDVIRVRKHINNKYGKKTPEQQEQISQDEEYARQLSEHEKNGSKGPAPVPPPGLFTSTNGKLANNTRRGRPERKSTLTDTVDPGALAAASDQLAKVSLTPMEPSKPATPPVPPVSVSPPPEERKEPPAPKSGFDDDAWSIKPVAKAASPAPQATPSPAPAAPAGTDALLAQIQQMRPSSTGPPPGGNAFESIAAANAAVPQRTGSISMPPPSSYGLGAASTNTPMSQLSSPPQQQQAMNPHAPRGPLAPVKVNEGLLNPMTSQTTGMFVPTHNSGSQAQSPFAGGVPAGQYLSNMQPMVTGMQPMMTGMQQPMMTGMQPMYTGYQQPQSTFNAIASIPPPQVPQPTGASGGDKFAPTNIFSAMKRTEYGGSEEQSPQASAKYDALRPLTTGYNGAPGMYPQQTGMMMQPTGMMQQPMMQGGMGMQQTGMPMMGNMGQQMTGYPGYMQGYQQY